MTVASVIALTTLVTYYTVRLAGERDTARRQAAKAEQVSAFLQGLFEVSDPSESKGHTVTARELLDQGAARIEKELANQPDTRASMMRVIGEVYYHLGLYATAKPLLERALAEDQRLFGPAHEEVAESEEALAVLLQSMGDLEASEPLYRNALATVRQEFGPRHERVSESLGLLSFMLETKGQFAEAEQAAREALEIDQALHPPDHPNVIRSKAKLAGLLRRLDRLAEAEPLLREALAAQRRIYGDHDLTVASTIRNLASLLRDRGALDEAETLYREAIAIRRDILGDTHPEVANVLNSYAVLLDRKGDYEGAVAAYREFIRISELAYQGQPHPDLSAGYSNLASTLRTLDRLDEAADAYRRSIAIGDQVIAPGHPNRAFPRLGLAGVYVDQRRFALAEPLIREALALRRGGLPANHRYIGDCLIELGTCLTGLGRFTEAEKVLQEARRLFLDTLGAKDDRTGRADRRLESLYKAWGRLAPAR
jgi:serine/threonine-protein kinase